MSRNRKYIEQFDHSAGKPSDFDSLFHFEKGELIAKRKIRVKSTRSRIAAMCSAAAVIGIAAFAVLAYINTKGLTSDSVMSRSTGDDFSEFTAYIEEDGSQTMLSSFIYRFEYEVTGDMSGNAELVWDYSSDTDTQNEYITDWQAVMRFRVISKKYTNGKIVYCINPLEYYVEEEVSGELNSSRNAVASINETITFSVPAYDLRELQTGGEYIMPFLAYDLTSNDVIFHADSTGYFAEKTDKGWLIYNCGVYHFELIEALEADAEEIYDDRTGTGSYHLEPSDEKMSEKIRAFLESKDTVYYHTEFESSTVQTTLDDILPNAEFEKIRYAVKETGEPDRTLLILDNEQYFSLLPYISGNVVFAGRTLNGCLCAAVELEYNDGSAEEYYCRTILMSGFTELYVSTGDSIDENTVIGVCGSEPVYMQFIDNNGMPMEIDINDFFDETSVSAEDEVIIDYDEEISE
ncbi:MAG: hypothetical protein PUI48_02630 [Oscillospiraceae bacterium]|nr:hypothetical protein [Oscillospiraceae bacterium]MDY6207714.1 hypothetical protein [Oscillospiraceae bacterium]